MVWRAIEHATPALQVQRGNHLTADPLFIRSSSYSCFFRSYVVRHVRDTHRNKPVRVIDLSKGNEPEDIPEYMTEGVGDSRLNDTAEHFDADGNLVVNSFKWLYCV